MFLDSGSGTKYILTESVCRFGDFCASFSKVIMSGADDVWNERRLEPNNNGRKVDV